MRKPLIVAACNGATMHEVREFAGHADIRTTEVYFIRKEEDAEVAARRIQIRLAGMPGRSKSFGPSPEAIGEVHRRDSDRFARQAR